MDTQFFPTNASNNEFTDSLIYELNKLGTETEYTSASSYYFVYLAVQRIYKSDK